MLILGKCFGEYICHIFVCVYVGVVDYSSFMQILTIVIANFDVLHLSFDDSRGVELATGSGNPPAVRVWTAKTGRFVSRPGQNPDLLTVGGPNPDSYPSTSRFRRV